MLRIDDVERISRLHGAGQQPSAIAAEVGCALQTVYTVLNGHHPLQLPGPKRVASSRRKSFDASHDYVSGVGFQHEGGAVKCPGCGGIITQQPCVLCAALGL